ncbi:MAG: hypothetical protein JNJ57_08690 [Saprospiraceae bacterium]|nr:hypothetical protein [Saprospiraceae bacterium]
MTGLQVPDMNKLTYFCTVMLFLSTTALFGQTFSGFQTDKKPGYHCHLQINQDSTIRFIYFINNNWVYGEYAGTITKTNAKLDLYRINATMTFGQFIMKAYQKDTLYISMDSEIATQLDKIQIEYADKKTRKLFQGYDHIGKPISLIKMPVDKKLFNAKKGTDYVTITINRKNFLTDKFLSFNIDYGSASSFTSGKKIEFYAVIKGDQLWTVGTPPLQTGHFKLKRTKGI